MTLGCDKHREKKMVLAQMCPWIFAIQNLLMQKPPFLNTKRRLARKRPLLACKCNVYPIIALHINIPSNITHTITVTQGPVVKCHTNGYLLDQYPISPPTFTCPSQQQHVCPSVLPPSRLLSFIASLRGSHLLLSLSPCLLLPSATKENT